MPHQVLLLLALTASLWNPPGETPRSVLREVTAAVEKGTVRQAEAGWRRRVQADSADAAALYGMASLARLSYAYTEALTWYSRVHALPRERRGRFEAFATLGEAQVLWVTSRYSEAGERYAEAVRQAREALDPEAEAIALLGLGSVRLRSNEPAAAAASFDSASQRIRTTDFDLRAAQRCARAALFVRTNPPKAISDARAGLRLAQRAGDGRQEATCLHMLAQAEIRLGNLTRASATLDTVVARLGPLRDHGALASALQWSGYVASTRVQYTRAQALLGRAINEAEVSGNRSALAWSLLNLGAVSTELSDPTSAEGYLERSLALMRELGDQWGRSTALGMLGRLAYSIGDVQRADSIWAGLLDEVRRAGDVAQEADLEYGLAASAMRRRDWAAAARALDLRRMALRRAGRTPDQIEMRYERGVFALKQGRWAEARQLLESHFERLDTTARLDRYYTESRLAEIAVRLGDTTEAERRLRHAGDELDRWRETLSDSALRVLAFQTQDDFADHDPGAALVTAAVAGSGRLAAAFALAERRRARDLRDQLLRTRRTEDGNGGRRARPGLLPASDVTLQELAGALPDHRTAFLEYVVGRGSDPTTLFVVTRDTARFYRLQSFDSLIDPLARFPALLESGLSDSVNAASLGRALLGPALADLPASVDRLIIVPDGGLHRLPFAALRIRARAVIQRYSLQVVPAAAVAVALWSRPPSRLPLRILAFADPDYPTETSTATPVARAHFAAFAERGGLSRLPYSADEARAAAALAPGSEVRLRRAASEYYLKHTRLDGFRVLDFATHALVDERALGRSAIALSAGGGEDGFVTAGDLAALRLRADLVVLSGCATALGVLVGGEGILGLTAPLLQAGARGVMATLWPVSDREAARFVSRFYRWLGTGMATADALRRAQVEAAERGDPPRTWAAFVLTGDGSVRVAPPPR